MSKYDPIWNWINQNKKDDFNLSFREIEEIISFQIDHSFLKFKKELLDYGFEVKKISMKDKTVMFGKIK